MRSHRKQQHSGPVSAGDAHLDRTASRAQGAVDQQRMLHHGQVRQVRRGIAVGRNPLTGVLLPQLLDDAALFLATPVGAGEGADQGIS